MNSGKNTGASLFKNLLIYNRPPALFQAGGHYSRFMVSPFQRAEYDTEISKIKL